MSHKFELLGRILKELRGLIRRDEGSFADMVLGDLEDALAISQDKYKTACKWLRDYQSLSSY